MEARLNKSTLILVAAGIGITVLLSWAGFLPQYVRSVGMEHGAMKVSAAMAVVALSVAMLSFLLRHRAVVFDILAGVFAALAILFILSPWTVQILPRPESFDAVKAVAPNTPSLGALLCTVILGIGLLGGLYCRRILSLCSWAVLGIAIAAITGYVTGAGILYWWVPGWSTALAIPAAWAFVALATGGLPRKPPRQLLAEFDVEEDPLLLAERKVWHRELRIAASAAEESGVAK